MSRVWDALQRSAYLAERVEARLPVTPSHFGMPGETIEEIPAETIPSETIEVRPETRLFAHTDPRGPAADRLRYLRLRLNEVWNAEKLKRLLITSPQPHDGKSTIALNLAVTLAAEGERKVLLIEGDLHRATISAELGLSGRPGVAECLEDNTTQPYSLVRRIEPIGCYFLPAGNPKGNPSELLQQPNLSTMMESLVPHFDWILIDSPPVVPLTDALSWKARADATLLVVRAGHTPTSATEEALNLVGKKHTLAIVLNGVEGLDSTYKKYYKAYGNNASSSKRS